jgi:hypothetical protein
MKNFAISHNFTLLGTVYAAGSQAMTRKREQPFKRLSLQSFSSAIGSP